MNKEELSNQLINRFNINRYSGHNGTYLIDDLLHMSELAIQYNILPSKLCGNYIYHWTKVRIQNHLSKQDAWLWCIGLSLLEIKIE